MNDLIDRIRAYVAAIPTHECVACGYEFQGADIPCPDCGFPPEHHFCRPSEADALLREVAALEPVSKITRSPSGAIAMFAPHGGPFDMSKHVGNRFYTLTGATHD